MSFQSHQKLGRRLALVVGVAGAILISPAANAQSDSRYRDTATPNGSHEPEEVYVYGPRIHVERSTFGGVEKVSLSRAVRFDDLDLRTTPGARELRLRVRNVAQNLCEELESAYPFPEAIGTSCYRTAVQGGLVRANRAIRDVRSDSD